MAVRVEGLRETRTKVRRILDDMDRDAARGELKQMNADAAQIVARRAQQLVPVRSGTLRNTVRPSGTQKSARVRAGFARVPYAGPIHFGWASRNITPQPFLYSALDSRRREVVEHYHTQIGKLIDRYGLD